MMMLILFALFPLFVVDLSLLFVKGNGISNGSSSSTASPPPCTPCPHNPDDSYNISNADQSVTVPGLGTVTCGFIQSTLAQMPLPAPTCARVQAVATFVCGGCLQSRLPTAQPPMVACPGLNVDSCGSSSGLAFQPTALIDNFDQVFLPHNNNTAAAAAATSSASNRGMSCQVVDAYFKNFVHKDDPICRTGQEAWSATCGCHSLDPSTSSSSSTTGSSSNKQPDNNNNNQKDSCQTRLCLYGGSPAFPQKDMSQFYRESHQLNALIATTGMRIDTPENITCATADQIMQSGILPASFCGSDEHDFVAGSCGCPAPDDACVFCPTHDMTRPHDSFHLAEIVYGMPATCRETELRLTQTKSRNDARCWAAKHLAGPACGCNDGVSWYLGAATRRQHATLAWTPRVSGTLSLLGSLYIVQDIVRQYSMRAGNWRQALYSVSTYHAILLVMSFFDMLGSLAWIVSTAALPAYDTEREIDSGVYGAMGTDVTCKVQGFLLELGFVGSTASNASLTIFYLLAIVYNFRETQTKPLRKYLVAIPSLIAMILAAAAVPYYRPFYVACLVSNPNTEVSRYADEWIYLIVFSIIPVGLAMAISVGNMAVICRFVCKHNRKADRWRFPNTSLGSGDFSAGHQSGFDTPSVQIQPRAQPERPPRRRQRSEKAVFWQAFWYVFPFLLTWVIYLVGQFKPYFSSNDNGLYAFWIIMLILNPLMGFWNAFAYMKPWTWRKSQTNRPSQQISDTPS